MVYQSKYIFNADEAASILNAPTSHKTIQYNMKHFSNINWCFSPMNKNK